MLIAVCKGGWERSQNRNACNMKRGCKRLHGNDYHTQLC